MMKFRSLMFREFRLSRKGIVLQAGLFLSLMALMWGMLLSSDANELTVDEMLGIADTVILMTALVAPMFLMLDESFKSDVNSGWLGYSYALPIKPLERVAAKFVCRFLVCLGCILLSLCNAAAICAYIGKEFGANQIVWHIASLAAMILFSLPNDIFLLHARSAADLKKMQMRAGLTQTALVIVSIIVIFKASGVDLEKLGDGETFIERPVFTAGDLAWAVPLLLAMMAAGFWTAYFSLRSAYPCTAKTEKAENENTETNPQAALPEKTSGPTGLLYKELKQNRLVFILAAAAPILLTAYPFCLAAIIVMTGSTGVDGFFETATNVIMRLTLCLAGIFIISGLMSEVFKGDDKKLWAYFVVSTPNGVKGFLYRKYVVTLMVNLIYMAAGIFAESLLATVHYFVIGSELTTNMLSLYISGVFLLMGISALDIPFTVRYGAKRGSIIKTTAMLLISTAGVVVYSLLPDDISMKLTETIVAIFNGEGANDMLMLILSLFPYIALAAFLLSYKIACRLFMKGVNEYDK